MVSIATWNVENLFTPDADSGPDTAAEFAAKADALAATISEMDPDVLALQEIGALGALENVLGRVGGRWYVETAEPDGRGIRVAIAARTPSSQVYQVGPFLDGLRPVQVDDTAVGETAMGRPALHAVVDGVHVLTCHLKSKLLTFPGGRFSPRDEDERARFATYALFRRAAEAATVRAAATTILAADGDAPLVVLGDLNDTVDAATTQLMAGPGCTCPWAATYPWCPVSGTCSLPASWNRRGGLPSSRSSATCLSANPEATIIEPPPVSSPTLTFPLPTPGDYHPPPSPPPQPTR